VTTSDLPFALAPGASHPVSVRVRLPLTPGLFNRKAFFWTDDAQAQLVVFPITGMIEPAQGLPSGDSR
jgi:heptaprenylglyceryl phosphate synthase